jgi:hypothetical protein
MEETGIIILIFCCSATFFGETKFARQAPVHAARPGQCENGTLTDQGKIMAGGWGCPHEVNGHCNKVGGMPCNPGMKGCELAGRFRFVNEDKNVRFYEKQARKAPTEHHEEKE